MPRTTSYKCFCIELLYCIALYCISSLVVLRFLSSSPLDEIIDKLGGPSCVAEMTGRRGRMVQRSPRSKPQYELRDKDSAGGLDSINVKEVSCRSSLHCHLAVDVRIMIFLSCVKTIFLGKTFISKYM